MSCVLRKGHALDRAPGELYAQRGGQQQMSDSECSLLDHLVGLGPFKTIVADPPWRLTIGKTRTQKGIKACGWNATDGRNPALSENYQGRSGLPYGQMTVDDIATMPISGVADRGAHLYLWTINAHLEAAYAVARAWGFRPATLLTWCKAPMGLGLGGTFCNATEFCLFARRGTLKAQRRIDRTWWLWKRGRHSAKPEAFQDMVETVSPGPYLELFARRQRLGWVCWGNEVETAQRLG
jgi:N6-adenosine-specific RNA methylase IME4